jgi:hypothetical protein
MSILFLGRARITYFIFSVFLSWISLYQFTSAQTINNFSVFLDTTRGINGPTGIALDATNNIYIYELNPIPR